MFAISPKALFWLKTLSKFVSVQIVVQVLGAASGIFLVRTLDQKHYAYYTIALAMQSTMSLLADLGIGVSLWAIGGKVWQDKHRFGQLVNTALQVRYYLAGISVTVVTPILLWMLIKNGASVIDAILIMFLLLVGLNFQLTIAVLSVVPKLHSQISIIQNLELLSAIVRLALLGIAYLAFLNAPVAIAIAAIVLGLHRYLLGRWVATTINIKASINNEDKKFILSKVTELAPNGIFFCLQNQLSIWLISIFGSTENVAEIGALGRIAFIFAILNSLMNTILSPSFARCQSLVMLRRRYFQIIGGSIILGIALVGIAVLFPRQLLWILGSNYTHLDDEVRLMVLSSTIAVIVRFMASLNGAKAWVQYAWVEIPLRISLQIVLLFFLDISTIKGVLWFGIFSHFSPFAVSILRAYFGFKTLEKSTV